MAAYIPTQPETPDHSSEPRSFSYLKRRVWIGALLVLSFVLILALGSGLFRPGLTPAYAAAGEYSLSLTGLRPDPDLDLSGYLQIPHAPELNPSGGEITIEAWVKRNEVLRQETVVGNGYQVSYWLGFTSTGELLFRPYGTGSGVTGSAKVPAGVWTHIAVTYDGTYRRYYINGVLDTSSSLNAGDLTPGDGFLGIGFDVDDVFMPNYFGGLIDNVRIWNVVRSPAEIKDGMFQSFTSPPAGLLAAWDLDGDADDPVGGHDGTLVGVGYYWSNQGAVPHDIRIPQLAVTPSLDGHCQPDE